METEALNDLLNQLVADWESEVVEFKQAGYDYSTDKIGKYFSALCNEANLKSAENSWFVFGINNKIREVAGTDYRPDSENLQNLKWQISQNTEPSITFSNIFELQHEKGRVLFFQIPAAPMGIPVAWKGHYYARAGESLVALGVDKLDFIRNQTQLVDWTAQVVEDATFEHLDNKALEKAKESFAQKYANRFSSEDVYSWSESTFLDRARITRDGKLTRAALLLLGKAESSHLLLPNPAQMTWKLEDLNRAYEHFSPPFLLNTTALFQKIRNFQMRILPDSELLPVEVTKYDQQIVLEALHNCIVHQDYTRNTRIIVSEFEDRLVFENEGSFFEGSPTDYILGDKTPRRYRNPFLAQAMAELNMIDTMGYGIHTMHQGQAKRFFPLPDYDMSESGVVKLILHGKVVDPSYSKLLIQHTDIPFRDILALDRVQKKLPIDEDAVKQLRRMKLIEGRKPNFHISASIAKATDLKVDYIKTRAQDDEFYSKLVLDFILKFGTASRGDINKLLWDKLSGVLDEDQKQNKISNLLTNLRRSGKIQNTKSRKKPKWEIAE